MNSRTKQMFVLLLVLGLALVLSAACGGGGATETPADAPAATEPAMEEQEGEMPAMDHTDEPAATEAPAAEEPTAESAAPSESPQVLLEGFQFSPATLTVSAGTTVTWTNNEGVQHTVTADDDSFGSDTLPEGGTIEFTFDTPGTYAYHCRFHGGVEGEGMSGVITVTE